jgi:hypothetical protein
MRTLRPENGNPEPLQGAQLVGRRLVTHLDQTPGGGATKTAAQRQGRVAARETLARDATLHPSATGSAPRRRRSDVSAPSA